jgi:FKBP-type peptidyl-prolyl cis-trans isomerase FkpA/FKBP-type peptidyl-prolyl cis-trans isomerase FklB
MTSAYRATTTSLLAASMLLAIAACKPVDKDAAPGSKADDSPAAAAAIPGLKTEKQQVSYMIGMQLGQSMKPVKDEIDLDTVMRAVRTTLDDGELLMTEEQAMQVAQSFGERMQAKQQAEAEALAKTNLAEGEKFLAGNAKKPNVQTTASGLQYQVLTEGKGAKPTADQTVRVHYKGELLDGTTFDSSYDRGEPAVFALNQVAPGWAEGVQLMPVGSKYKLWIPSKLGYGEQGTPGGPIGPNATLVFEVELLDIVQPEAAPTQ